MTEFELGKYYMHTTGTRLYICGVCDTLTYGMCIVGEDYYGNLIPIGKHEGATENYKEISREEFLNDAVNCINFY